MLHQSKGHTKALFRTLKRLGLAKGFFIYFAGAEICVPGMYAKLENIGD